MFNITPLLGAQSASPASQYLLEFEGGVKVLIDVGWDEDFDVAKLKSLERWVVLYVLGHWVSHFEGFGCAGTNTSSPAVRYCQIDDSIKQSIPAMQYLFPLAAITPTDAVTCT